MSLSHAESYTHRGWFTIPVNKHGKSPIIKNWPEQRLKFDDLGKHFSPGINVGVLLGEPSGWLVDVDLDSPEAVMLAPKYLPPTGAKFGHKSKPNSHWLYRAMGQASKRFSPPRSFTHSDQRNMIVEIRSTGAQTVFPGSTHPSGEEIEWMSVEEPALVAKEHLEQSVIELYEAALLLVKIKAALNSISPDCGYDVWINMGLILYNWDATFGFDIWNNWSKHGASYRKEEMRGKWTSFSGGTSEKKITIASLFRLAKENGWVDPQSHDGDQEGYCVESASVGERCSVAEKFRPFQPLDAVPSTPPYPVDCLPPAITEFVSEATDRIQCPPDYLVMFSLAAASIAVQRKAVVAVGCTHIEPLNLWAIAVGAPSERKSEAMRKPLQVIRNAETDARIQAATEIAAAKRAARQNEARLKHLEGKVAKGNIGDDEREELRRLADQANCVPAMPMYYGSDITPEQVGNRLVEQGGVYGIIDAEGNSPIANALGRYGDSNAKLENMLRAYRLEEIRIDRMGRSEQIVWPHLTIGLAVQPGPLRRMGARQEVRDQGFAARWDYYLPTSRVGTRLYNMEISQIPGTVLERYESTIQALLCLPKIQHLDSSVENSMPQIKLSPAALSVWKEFHDEIEMRMGAGRDLHLLSDLAGKLAGHAVRKAGILHCLINARDGVGLFNNKITAETMTSAVRITHEYYLPHAIAAYKLMFDAPEKGLALRIVSLLQSRKNDPAFWPVVSKQALWQQKKGTEDCKKADDLDMPLETLVQRGYLKKLPPEVGKKNSVRFLVNDAAFQSRGGTGGVTCDAQ